MVSMEEGVPWASDLSTLPEGLVAIGPELW